MDPDIEWHIGDDAERETVIASSRRPSPWRAAWVAGVVCLGIALGVLYRSIPEPPPRPAPAVMPSPAPSPTPLPSPSVAETIEQESVALASGDLQTFLNLQDTSDARWYDTQLGLFRTWGLPDSGPFYTTVASGTLADERYWADIVQFRRSQYFRQTRFYQRTGGRWLRIAPPQEAAFWGAEQTAATAHFTLTYRGRDAALAAAIGEQYEALYARVCRDLQCPQQTPQPAERALQIILGPEVTTPLVEWRNDQLIYTLPSPSLAGLYFTTRQTNQPSPDRPFNQSVLESLVYYVARLSASQPSTWLRDVNSVQFLGIIAKWESLRLMGQPARRLLVYPEQLASRDLPDLAALWGPPPVNSSQLAELRWIESTALIAFIDERYGSDKIVTFLHALSEVRSLPDLIKISGQSDPDFQQQWRVWLRQVVTATQPAKLLPPVP